jgi:hypothetical protein
MSWYKYKIQNTSKIPKFELAQAHFSSISCLPDLAPLEAFRFALNEPWRLSLENQAFNWIFLLHTVRCD